MSEHNPREDSMSILEFHAVKKDYKLGETTVRALRRVDLAVDQGNS
jgi:hypothetical protein